MATLTFDASVDGNLLNPLNWAPNHNAVPTPGDDAVIAADCDIDPEVACPGQFNCMSLSVGNFRCHIASVYAVNARIQSNITVLEGSSLSLRKLSLNVTGPYIFTNLRATPTTTTATFTLGTFGNIVTSSSLIMDSFSNDSSSTTDIAFNKTTTNGEIFITGDCIIKNGCVCKDTQVEINGNVTVIGGVSTGTMFQNDIFVCNGDVTLSNCAAIENASDMVISGNLTVGNVSGVAFNLGSLDCAAGNVVIGTVGSIFASAVTGAIVVNSLIVGSIGNSLAHGASVLNVSTYIVTGAIGTAGDSAIVGSSSVTVGTYFCCGGVGQFFISGGTSSIVAGEYIEIGYVGFVLKGAGLPTIDTPFMYLGSLYNSLGPYKITTRAIGPWRKWATYVDNTPVNHINSFALTDTTSLPLPLGGSMGYWRVEAVTGSLKRIGAMKLL
jgi:hypothetical protein